MTNIGLAYVEFRTGRKRKMLVSDHKDNRVFVMHLGKKQYVRQDAGKWYPVRKSAASKRVVDHKASKWYRARKR